MAVTFEIGSGSWIRVGLIEMARCRMYRVVLVVGGVVTVVSTGETSDATQLPF